MYEIINISVETTSQKTYFPPRCLNFHQILAKIVNWSQAFVS